MKKFRIDECVTAYRYVYIMAEDINEAKEKWIYGDDVVREDDWEFGDNYEINDIEEVED